MLYSLVRLGIFAVTLVVLLLAAVPGWLAAILAAIIGFCVAYIFFGRLRAAVARDFAERRARSNSEKDTDSDAEDLESDTRFG